MLVAQDENEVSALMNENKLDNLKLAHGLDLSEMYNNYDWMGNQS